MKNYKELDVYQLSFDLAVKVHKVSLRFPTYELYEEGSQVRRSSKGISASIVEGYGRRRYKADFIKFLIYAHASCDETILHLNFIKEIHEDYGDEIDRLLISYDELGAKINRFVQYVETNWNEFPQPATRNPHLVTRNP